MTVLRRQNRLYLREQWAMLHAHELPASTDRSIQVYAPGRICSPKRMRLRSAGDAGVKKPDLACQ